MSWFVFGELVWVVGNLWPVEVAAKDIIGGHVLCVCCVCCVLCVCVCVCVSHILRKGYVYEKDKYLGRGIRTPISLASRDASLLA